MTKDNRRVMTWTHIESNPNYRNDIEKFNHKIYSIGLHEFGVRSSGKIFDYNSTVNYFNADGSHTGIRYPVLLENDVVNYPSIKWYLQMIAFGWGTVKIILDNNVLNAEGRLPQDQFVYELNKIINLFSNHRTSGIPLNFEGIEMDVEASMTADTVSNGNDVNYIRFLEKIKNEVIIPRQLKMRVNAHAMIGDNAYYYYRFHNYKLFAESVDMNGNATIDEIQLMTYDFAWNGSSAGASTPIWWFKQVGEWCLDNFDPARNPNAKLTIDNLYFGAAGYGHRWGMATQQDVKQGSNITYHQLLGWENGQFRHFHTEVINGVKTWVYHDQEYLFQTSFQDEESKNEIMYPHIYEMYKPKYVEVKEIDGGRKSATVGTFNRLDYAASNFKLQMPIWTNVRSIANVPSSVSGKAFALKNPIRPDPQLNASDPLDYPALRVYDPNLDMESVNFQHIIKSVDGVDKPFVGYRTVDRRWELNADFTACELEAEPEGRVNYSVNVPASGNYRVIALTSFGWFTQATLGGTINGANFTVGGASIPDWYPYFVKGSHWFDCGSFALGAGANTITVMNERSEAGTPIYGFVVCDAFNPNFSGGELEMKSNIQPFKSKDGTNAPLPTTFAVAAKMLRRDARPAILWDDEFRTYDEGSEISGQTYYRKVSLNKATEGAGNELVGEGTTAKCFSPPIDTGYTQGIWKQKNFEVAYDSDESEAAIGSRSAQLILSKQWSVNLSIEGTFRIDSGSQAGIRFHAQSQGTVADGYVFRVDLNRNVRELIYEKHSYDPLLRESYVVASQPLGNVTYGTSFILKVILHNGVGRFYVGKVQAFVAGTNNQVTHNGSVNTTSGQVNLIRSSGAVGIYANDVKMSCSHLGISTTDRWETLEKFEVEIENDVGQPTKLELGRIARKPEYTYDEFGYLIYSGLSEKADTRLPTPAEPPPPIDPDNPEIAYESSVSLDYEVTVFDMAAWSGTKAIKIKLRDAGVWFGEMLIGDREGMSIIWAGSALSFQNAMNMAVDDYGAKGIGLWAMGQEDPKVWELIPDVVPKK